MTYNRESQTVFSSLTYIYFFFIFIFILNLYLNPTLMLWFSLFVV